MAKYTTTVRGNRMTQLNTDIGNGAKIRLYKGTTPTDANTAISGQTLVAEWTGGSPFGTVSAPTLTMSGAPLSTTASAAMASGDNCFIRLFKSDGSTVIGDFTCDTTGAEFTINNKNVSSGQTINLTGATITAGNA